MSNINLYWWRPPGIVKRILKKRYRHMKSNFGDELSRVIVEKVIGETVVRAKQSDENKLLALGSIMHFAKDGDTIWGTGINGKMLNRETPSINALSVRGPLTRDVLLKQGIACPELYGDPGLLMSRYFKVTPTGKRPYGIVPHFSEMDHDSLKKYKNEIINPCDNHTKVVQEIVNCELVVSSSLHGIVIAESYGIPAVLLRITENEPIFKYSDYYQGSGRSNYVFANTVASALSKSPVELPDLSNITIDEELRNWAKRKKK